MLSTTSSSNGPNNLQVLDISKKMGAESAVMLATEIVAHGALQNQWATTIAMGNNRLQGAEAGKVLGDTIAVNNVLTELDLSSPSDECGDSWPCDAAFAKEFAAGLRAHAALTDLNMSNNNVGQLVLPEGWEEGVGCFYGPNDEEQEAEPEGSSRTGVLALANAIATMGALEKLLLDNNALATKEAGKALAEALAANSSLKELGVSDNLWDNYDDWGKIRGDGPGFARELAAGVSASRALTSLNVSSNSLGGHWVVRGCKKKWISDMTGVKALAAAIPKSK